jgi:hypothetical protein
MERLVNVTLHHTIDNGGMDGPPPGVPGVGYLMARSHGHFRHNLADDA